MHADAAPLEALDEDEAARRHMRGHRQRHAFRCNAMQLAVAARRPSEAAIDYGPLEGYAAEAAVVVGHSHTVACESAVDGGEELRARADEAVVDVQLAPPARREEGGQHRKYAENGRRKETET